VAATSTTFTTLSTRLDWVTEMPTIAELATAVDEIVHRTADDKFDITATLFGCDNDGAYILGSQGDPYELLWRTNRPDHINAIALVVTGWASPTDDEDIAPSKHPERIRVRMVVCKGIDGFTTVMRRADKPDEAEVMDEGGTGTLRDAMEAWWAK